MTDNAYPLTRDTQLVNTNSLTGMTLFDRAGDKLGVIKDVYLDRATGQVEFVVGATGGFLGVGEKFHPLPWRTLGYRASPEGYFGAFTRQDLANAPAYDKDQLASAHYGWGESVRRYFAGLGHAV